MQVSSIWDSVLEGKNVSITIPAEYLEYTDVAFLDFTAELSKHISLPYQVAH